MVRCASRPLKVDGDELRVDRYYALWLRLATTGLRRGEALRLRWSDIDLDGRVLSVAQTVITVDQPRALVTIL